MIGAIFTNNSGIIGQPVDLALIYTGHVRPAQLKDKMFADMACERIMAAIIRRSRSRSASGHDHTA